MGEYQDRVERGGVRPSPWRFRYIRFVKSTLASDVANVDSGVPFHPDYEFTCGLLTMADGQVQQITTPELVYLGHRNYGYQQQSRMMIKVRPGGLSYGDFNGNGITHIKAGGGNQQSLPDFVNISSGSMGGSIVAGSWRTFTTYRQSVGIAHLFVILSRRIHGMGPIPTPIYLNQE